jgi:hypothetical protein
VNALTVLFDRVLARNLPESDMAALVQTLSTHGKLLSASLETMAGEASADRLNELMALYQLSGIWPDLRFSPAWHDSARLWISEFLEQTSTSLIDPVTATAIVGQISDASQYLAEFGEPLTKPEAALAAGILPGGPPGYVFCGHEGQTCELDATRDVAFGLGGQFAYGSFGPGPVACTAQALGDVVPGFTGARNCYLR